MLESTAVLGTCHDQFSRVRDAFEQNLAELDVGASVAITLNGEFIVDLWGGYSDEARQHLWHEDTIVNVYSSTKTMAALCGLILVDRGQLDLDAPVAQYWPEFAQNGKADVRVRHLMSHTSGVAGWEGGIGPETLYDWDAACALLAKQELWWEPGTASGYHGMNQGHLIGEVLRRIDGRSIGTFFAEEVAAPLDADFFIGVPESEFPRIAELIPPGVSTDDLLQPEPGSIAARIAAGTAVDVAWAKTAGWRQAEIPAANGHGNARSMARAQTPMACGGAAFGHRLLSDEGTRRVFEEQSNGADLMLGLNIRFGMGYALANETFPLSPNPHTCLWGGYGGSMVVVDQDVHVCFTYAMNRMLPETIVGDIRSRRMLDAFYRAL